MYSETYLKIWQVVAAIPYGKVATYGQVARVAGMEGQARLVGYALHATPASVNIPWQRVVNSRGRISFPPDDPRHARQKALLLSEGIPFTHNRIDLDRFQWQIGKENVDGYS